MFENESEDLSPAHGARLFELQLNAFLQRCAAALRGILDAESGGVLNMDCWK
jgi:hypothetical protein